LIVLCDFIFIGDNENSEFRPFQDAKSVRAMLCRAAKQEKKQYLKPGKSIKYT